MMINKNFFIRFITVEYASDESEYETNTSNLSLYRLYLFGHFQLENLIRL